LFAKEGLSGPVADKRRTFERGARAFAADEVFLTVDQVACRYGVARSTIWRWASTRDGFPKPVRIAEGTTRWAQSDLVRYDRDLQQLPARKGRSHGRGRK